MTGDPLHPDIKGEVEKERERETLEPETIAKEAIKYTGCFKSHARFYTVKKSMDIFL